MDRSGRNEDFQSMSAPASNQTADSLRQSMQPNIVVPFMIPNHQVYLNQLQPQNIMLPIILPKYQILSQALPQAAGPPEMEPSINTNTCMFSVDEITGIKKEDIHEGHSEDLAQVAKQTHKRKLPEEEAITSESLVDGGLEFEKKEKITQLQSDENICAVCRTTEMKRRATMHKYMEYSGNGCTVGEAMNLISPHFMSQKVNYVRYLCYSCNSILFQIMKLQSKLVSATNAWDKMISAHDIPAATKEENSQFSRPGRWNPENTGKVKRAKIVKTKDASTQANIIIKKNRSPLKTDNRRPVWMACEALQKHRYTTAYNILFHKCRKAKDKFVSIVKNEIRRELSTYMKTCKSLPSEVTLNNLRHFSWDSFIMECQSSLPLTFAALASALTKQRRESNVIGDGRKDWRPRMGMMLSCCLYTRHPTIAKFLQSVISVHLWQAGCSQQLLRFFHAMGLSQCRNAAKACLKKLTAECEGDEELLRDLKNGLQEGPTDDDSETEICEEGEVEDLDDMEETEEDETELGMICDDEEGPRYTDSEDDDVHQEEGLEGTDNEEDDDEDEEVEGEDEGEAQDGVYITEVEIINVKEEEMYADDETEEDIDKTQEKDILLKEIHKENKVIDDYGGVG